MSTLKVNTILPYAGSTVNIGQDTNYVRHSSGRYYLEEFFEQLPATEAPTTVSQATNITTAVTSNSKYTLITTQAIGTIAASEWIEFTFTNAFITANSIVLAVVQDTADNTAGNEKALIQVNDVAAGSCEIRLINPSATTTTSQVYKIAVIVDPHVLANFNFCLAGTNATDTEMDYATTAAGITMMTNGADNDQAILQPRTVTSQELGGNDPPTAWTGVKWGTENQVEWESAIRTHISDIGNMAFWAGLKLTSTAQDDTDANQAYFLFTSDDDSLTATLTTNANLHFIYSTAGTDYTTDLGIVVAADTTYRLRISIDSDRKVSIFVNDTQYGLTSTAGSTGASGTTATTKSLALTDDINLIPYIGVQSLTGDSDSLTVHYQKISRILFE